MTPKDCLASHIKGSFYEPFKWAARTIQVTGIWSLKGGLNAPNSYRWILDCTCVQVFRLIVTVVECTKFIHYCLLGDNNKKDSHQVRAYLTSFFVTFFFSKSLWESKSFENSYQRVQMIAISLKYILWFEFLHDLDSKSDFEKKNCHKKSG